MNNMFLDKIHISDFPSKKRIAVHFHVYYVDMIADIVLYLRNIPVDFDLYISVPVVLDISDETIEKRFSDIRKLCKITIARTPNRGRDIGPMLCTFGDILREYDVILHIHTKKSAHTDRLVDWGKHCFSRLLHSQEDVGKILKALSEDVGIVSPPYYQGDTNIWGNKKNLAIAQSIMNNAGMEIDLYGEKSNTFYPQGCMFWARTDFLKRLFDQKFSYNDFPEEPIGKDGTLAHALERLFFVWGRNTGLKTAFLYFNDVDYLDTNHYLEEISRLQNKNYKHLGQVKFLIWLSAILLVVSIILVIILFI